MCKGATRIEDRPLGLYLLTVQHHQTSFYIFIVLFSLLFWVPNNPVNLELLEFSLTIFSFISFILCISESSRPLKCGWYQSLPPYSNLELYSASLQPGAASSSLSLPRLALVSPQEMFAEWMNEWRMNEWMKLSPFSSLQRLLSV